MNPLYGPAPMCATVPSLIVMAWPTCSGNVASSVTVSSTTTFGWRLLWRICKMKRTHVFYNTSIINYDKLFLTDLSFRPISTDILVWLIILIEKCRNKLCLKVGWIDEHWNISLQLALDETLIPNTCICKSGYNSMTKNDKLINLHLRN